MLLLPLFYVCSLFQCLSPATLAAPALAQCPTPQLQPPPAQLATSDGRLLLRLGANPVERRTALGHDQLERRGGRRRRRGCSTKLRGWFLSATVSPLPIRSARRCVGVSGRAADSPRGLPEPLLSAVAGGGGSSMASSASGVAASLLSSWLCPSLGEQLFLTRAALFPVGDSPVRAPASGRPIDSPHRQEAGTGGVPQPLQPRTLPLPSRIARQDGGAGKRG